MSKTKAKTGQYKGHIILEIVALDDNGAQVGSPIVSFGVKKAKVILDHLPDIERFVKNHSSTTADTIDVTKLSDEQKTKLLTELLAT